MTYEEAKNKLKACGQEHVLAYYDELTEAEKAGLLEQIAATDFSVMTSKDDTERLEQKRGVIEPLAAMELPEIRAREPEFRAEGLKAIKAGKVGAVLLAGGMGTRLGSDNPKGMYDIGITEQRYIFQCLISNVMEVVNEAGTWIPFFVMTSDKNHDATVSFFKEKDYFGYNKDFVWFFKQEMAPASDYEGRAYMEDRCHIATSPNGNGGWFISMERTGINDVVREKGIEWLNVFAVDNVLQRIADPVLVGATILKGAACGAKVVKKAAPDEKVGAMCREDGRPSIIEYYDMTEELMAAKDDRGEPAYNFGVILNYLFKVSELFNIMNRNLPLHVVEKKIPYMAEDGSFVKPESPNGYKYESLVLDMIRELPNCLPFEVVREREFAPIKNKTGIDSVESARELLKLNGVKL